MPELAPVTRATALADGLFFCFMERTAAKLRATRELHPSTRISVAALINTAIVHPIRIFATLVAFIKSENTQFGRAEVKRLLLGRGSAVIRTTSGT
jgi:hypothetical protein